MTKNYSSPKEALLAAGRIEAITRGRISKPNNEWLDSQIASGAFTISGMTVEKSSSTTAAPVVKRTVQSAVKVISDIPDVFRDKDAYNLADEKGNVLNPKLVSLTSVCNVCKSSFTYCRCREPWFYFNNEKVFVTFVPKKR